MRSETMGVRAYWIGWNQPSADPRPITFPPPDFIIGWWCTGESGDDPADSLLVAHVVAESPEQAHSLIEQPSCWPDAGEVRFCKRKETQPGDRFPLHEWMKPRYAALSALAAVKGEGE